MADIFLLEDDRLLSKAITLALKKDNHNIISSFGYFEALDIISKNKFDIYLLDINLPDGNGIKICEKIRESLTAPVLFLTANDTEDDMLAGFVSGCDDYISKPFSIEVLRKKVSVFLKRIGAEKENIFRYKSLECLSDKCIVKMNHEEIHLTSTEYKILDCLIKNKGRIVTKNMLLESIWDVDGNFVDDNTLRVNIARLRQKLHDDKQEYIVTVFGMGYTFGE